MLKLTMKLLSRFFDACQKHNHSSSNCHLFDVYPLNPVYVLFQEGCLITRLPLWVIGNPATSSKSSLDRCFQCTPIWNSLLVGVVRGKTDKRIAASCSLWVTAYPQVR